MRLWTIQPAAVWDVLQRDGVFRADPALIDPDWRPAYAWLVDQMRRRLPDPGFAAEFPVWAWAQYDGPARPRPDLRRSGLIERGTRAVRLEIEIDDALVLCSDFDLWHFVLNRRYLGASEADDDAFHAVLDERGVWPWWTEPLAADLDAAIRASWERIFDLSWEEPYAVGDPAHRAIQATFWELPLASVRRVDWFTAR